MIEIINGVACQKKLVNNKQVYKKLQQYNIKGTPKIFLIEDSFIFYEHINGQTLREYIDSNPDITLKFASDITIILCNILNSLKKLDIIHKDLKPENIIISYKNEVYLIDFGASRIEDSKDQDTLLLGTKKYASPEHYGFSSTTYKSDIYSLGKIIMDLDKNNLLLEISKKCCHLDPESRYNDYDEIIRDVLKYTEGKVNYKTLEKHKFNNTNFYKVYNYFGTGMLIYIAFILVLSIIAFFDSLNESQQSLKTNIASTIYASFILIDIVDYLRIYSSKIYSNKIFHKKIMISLIAFVITIFMFI